jgi:hypothetical protein
MIRAVLDWTPQDTNASAFRFASTVVSDTLQNINFTIRASIRNLGTDALPIGTPVRLAISGPSAYTFSDTMATTSVMAHGATKQVNFPAWHIPDVAGSYNIKVWTQAAGEKYPADDTIAWDLGCGKWIDYFNDAPPSYWISWAGPERSTQLYPDTFSLQYPIGVSRVRAGFFLLTGHDWTDTSFTFKIYGDDGATVLWESDTIEANPGTPGAFNTCDVQPPVVISSGTFYVAVRPVSGSFPSGCADNVSRGHSYTGSGDLGWTPFTYGEFFISAAAQGNYGVEEKGLDPGVRTPSLQINNYPNPVTDQVTLKWQVPNSMPISVNLYDATGRLVRNLYAANEKARVGTITVDTRSLAGGIYLARIETAKGSATRKLVIDR